MRLAEDRFSSHLVEGESMRDLSSGRLLDDAVRGEAAIGLTDRRLLCVSNLGEFVDVRYDYICSIKSRQRTQVAYRSPDGSNRLLHLLGGLLVVVALGVGVLSFSAAGALEAGVTGLLAIVTVVVAATVESVRKRPGVGRTHEPVFVGAGVLALFGLVGASLLVAGVVTSLYALLTLGGLGLVGYAHRYRADLDGTGLTSHQETLLTINTIDGETVRIAVDTDADLDHKLSTCVHQRDAAPVDTPVITSPVD
ncbi:hypothetical protein GS429_01510 [Natronorubrum sp. JWXQ-INN-674]|uniref:Uncharacterized protein n=1 Tax=Natronorubrum halalkaliphilum TaxID=2691917 RepID=A0A6B0VGU9_9EURY|nr:hypothetical protein [Natronorubrum halalkaliphilum]MXV60768.1 hypothetical protein [Natronorubrum halalkaliphilum]